VSIRVTTTHAANIADVKPATIRQWLVRGHLTRYPDGVDVDELMHWVDTIRNDGKARGAILAAHTRHQTRRSA